MKSLSQLPDDLAHRAKTSDVISYNKLAKKYGLPRVTPESFHSSPLCDAFGLMDREDLTCGRPLRTALIYSEVLNHPGNGFFTMLALRRGQSISESRRAEEWAAELAQLRAHYNAS